MVKFQVSFVRTKYKNTAAKLLGPLCMACQFVNVQQKITKCMCHLEKSF